MKTKRFSVSLAIEPTEGGMGGRHGENIRV